MLCPRHRLASANGIVASSPALRSYAESPAASAAESPLLSAEAERELLRQLSQVDGQARRGASRSSLAVPELGVQRALSEAAKAATDAEATVVTAQIGAQKRVEAEVARIQSQAQSQLELAQASSHMASRSATEARSSLRW